MIMIKIALCILALILSPNVFAVESQENAKVNSYAQVSVLNQVAFTQENQQGTLPKSITQSPIEAQDVGFFTKFYIYLIIIMIYWLYWLINCRLS